MATTLRGDDNFDSASPIPAGNFTAKAWVNFNGTGTPAIRASGNVSSITDVSTGEYYANFSSAISDADYCISATTYLAGSATPAPFALASSTAQARLWVRAHLQMLAMTLAGITCMLPAKGGPHWSGNVQVIPASLPTV